MIPIPCKSDKYQYKYYMHVKNEIVAAWCFVYIISLMTGGRLGAPSHWYIYVINTLLELQNDNYYKRDVT